MTRHANCVLGNMAVDSCLMMNCVKRSLS